MDCKVRLEQYLREQDVPFQVQHHPEVFTAQEVAASEHVSGKQFAKVVMVLADGKLIMLALPAPKHVNLTNLKALLGAKDVRLATEEEFGLRFPGCDVGAMPPIGKLYDVPLYIDAGLAAGETIRFQAGTHTDTISLALADYTRVADAQVAELAVA